MRRALASGLVLCFAGAAHAQAVDGRDARRSASSGSVDVVVRDEPSPRRWVLIEWNPLPLATLDKLSANVVIAPVEHHAIVLSPFGSWTHTEPITVYAADGTPTQLPRQTFTGWGGEIGYRYYTGRGGPRGLFLGPSVIVGFFDAGASNGDVTHFIDYGLAFDVGYQMLVADRVSLSLGGGVQGLLQDKSIPAQQWPSKVYANSGVLPRLLVSIGWAL